MATILVLGGTGFIGPAIVETARARGHALTLFNRGTSDPGLFPDVESLLGDRDGALGALAGRRWDAVVDCAGYLPRVVRQSAELLAPAVEHYVFVSTISVYASFDRPGADEDAPLARIDDPADEDGAPERYGALKALCEQAVEAALPGRAAIIRAGLIVGPRDPTGRFTYWPARLARGGEILAPGSGADPVQLIDVRDLAGWIVHLVERRTVGVFNALGPAGRMTMEEMLAGVAAGAGATRPRLTWVDASFLAAEAVLPWSDMPAWMPAVGDMAGAGTISSARAVAAGLRFRSIEDTAAATLAWLRSLGPERRAAVTASGLAPEREAQVLARWHARPRLAT